MKNDPATICDLVLTSHQPSWTAPSLACQCFHYTWCWWWRVRTGMPQCLPGWSWCLAMVFPSPNTPLLLQVSTVNLRLVKMCKSIYFLLTLFDKQDIAFLRLAMFCILYCLLYLDCLSFHQRAFWSKYYSWSWNQSHQKNHECFEISLQQTSILV